MQQQKLFAGLLKKEGISDIELYDDELIYSISRLFVGEDWLIGFNKNNEVVISNILERSAHQQVVAQKEMNFILEHYKIYSERNVSDEKDRDSNRIR